MYLGKTLAENVGKCVISIFMSQIDFQFEDPAVAHDKPASTSFHPQPTYRMIVNPV